MSHFEKCHWSPSHFCCVLGVTNGCQILKCDTSLFISPTVELSILKYRRTISQVCKPNFHTWRILYCFHFSIMWILFGCLPKLITYFPGTGMNMTALCIYWFGVILNLYVDEHVSFQLVRICKHNSMWWAKCKARMTMRIRWFIFWMYSYNR